MENLDHQLTVVFKDELGNVVYAGAKAVYDIQMISINGKNNTVYMGSESDSSAFRIKIKGNANHVQIGARCKLVGGADISRGAGQSLEIGDGTTFQSAKLFVGENRSISIGNDCMFSSRIEIRTTDSHSVIDVDTGERINASGSVVIGDHVWIGKDVIVSKGVTLASNLIVGAKAFVNRSFDEEFIAIGGVPAKKVRSRVNWCRELLPMREVPESK